MTETHTIRPAAATSRRALFRPILVLLWCFLTVSAAMIAFLAVLASVGVGVDIAVWIRSSFVLASSVVLLLLGVFAARGSRAPWPPGTSTVSARRPRHDRVCTGTPAEQRTSPPSADTTATS